MKALSLWQPWSSLIAIGAKQYETRSWSTSYRGPLVIHAAKRWLIDQQAVCVYEPFRSILIDAGLELFKNIPLGAALCVVDLVDCQATEAVRHKISRNEHAFGDYEDGRFAWQLEIVERFRPPIQMRGAQGLFDCVLPTKGDQP
jgi:activating signal cointegrator 1